MIWDRPRSKVGRSPKAEGGSQTFWKALGRRHEVAVLGLLMIVSIFLGFQTDNFFTWSNLSNVARACSWIAIAAFGECMVIIIGGIDLSVGAVMGLSGLASALCLQANLPIPVAVLAGLSVGLAVGWINGSLVGRFGLPPFMVTLGTMSVFRGLIYGLTGGWPVRNLPAAFRALGQGNVDLRWIYVPLPVVFMLGLAVLIGFLLEKTVFGKYVYVLGVNERALRVSEVKVSRIRVMVYALGGLMTAVGGVLMTARLGVAAPTAAAGYELDVIAAAVIGGASLFGGEGNVAGVLLAAVLMQVLRNGLVLLGVPSYWQTMAIGVMILAFIALDHWRRHRRI